MGHQPENCKEVFALLSDYLNLELPPDACEQIQRHLADCPPCVEFVESLRKTVALCHKYDTGTMPRPLTEEAREDLQKAWKKMQNGRPAAGLPRSV